MGGGVSCEDFGVDNGRGGGGIGPLDPPPVHKNIRHLRGQTAHTTSLIRHQASDLIHIVAPELQDWKKLQEDQHMAMEGSSKEWAKASAKSQAAARRKMAGVPRLCKLDLPKIRLLGAKPSGFMLACWHCPPCCGPVRSQPTSTCPGSGIGEIHRCHARRAGTCHGL